MFPKIQLRRRRNSQRFEKADSDLGMYLISKALALHACGHEFNF